MADISDRDIKCKGPSAATNAKAQGPPPTGKPSTACPQLRAARVPGLGPSHAGTRRDWLRPEMLSPAAEAKQRRGVGSCVHVFCGRLHRPLARAFALAGAANHGSGTSDEEVGCGQVFDLLVVVAASPFSWANSRSYYYCYFSVLALLTLSSISLLFFPSLKPAQIQHCSLPAPCDRVDASACRPSFQPVRPLPPLAFHSLLRQPVHVSAPCSTSTALKHPRDPPTSTETHSGSPAGQHKPLSSPTHEESQDVESSHATTQTSPSAAMADLQGRKVFKVFNQDFVVDERYTVTKELGQGAYGIVW